MKWGQGHRLSADHVGGGACVMAYQDEVRLVGGQHEHRDVLIGQRGDDRLGDLGHADGLGAGEAAAPDTTLRASQVWASARSGVPKRAVLERHRGPACRLALAV